MLNEAKVTDQIGKTPFQLETYKTVAPESEGRFEITKFDKPQEDAATKRDSNQAKKF